MPDARRRAFTLLEVLAAVLILGLLYTLLADRAMRGLRSEGQSRRLTEAASLADTALVDLETLLALGAPVAPLREVTEHGDFSLLVEVAPEEVETLVQPPPGLVSEREDPDWRILADDRGNTRLFRINVVVSWEDLGQPRELRRTSWEFDRTQLAALFPTDGTESGDDAAGGADGEGGDGDSSDSSDGSRNSASATGGSEGDCTPDKLKTREDLIRCLPILMPPQQ